MANNSVIQEGNDIIFRNIVAAKNALSDAEVVKVTKVRPVSHSNAKGGLREIADVLEAAKIGGESGRAFLARFS